MKIRDYLNREHYTYLLETIYCPQCSLVQILETVPPEKLFREDYPYYSSFSDALLAHSRDNVLELIAKQNLKESALVMELASNDGYLLKNYVEQNIPVLGIDLAIGPAQVVNEIGVPTLNAFFGNDFALQLREEGKIVDVIHANNVLAHVADTNGFVEGMRVLIKADGVIVIEVPCVRDLIDHCEFDTVYHEHLCYFSVTALDKRFRRHGLYLNDICRLSIHGGSLRLFVDAIENVPESVKLILDEEQQEGVNQYPYYERFRNRVEDICQKMQDLLSQPKNEGKRIAAYGAAAKGTRWILSLIAMCISRVSTWPAPTILFMTQPNYWKKCRTM